MRIATPAFFCFPFAWNVFFHPLIFNLYVSLDLKCVSCRQHIYGSCFCVHSASLCFLVGAFNPFTVKVIIDIYVPIANLWNEVHDIVQETVTKPIPLEKKCKKAKWLSGEALQIAVKRREAKSKGEKERYKHLNAEFQRIAR